MVYEIVVIAFDGLKMIQIEEVAVQDKTSMFLTASACQQARRQFVKSIFGHNGTTVADERAHSIYLNFGDMGQDDRTKTRPLHWQGLPSD
jgi:hypothetical protein